MRSIEEALAVHEPHVRDALLHVVELARRAVPDATDGESYGVPALMVDGRPLVGVSVSSRHLSLVPFSPAALDTVRDELAGFGVSKGLVRFTPDHPVPDDVVERLVAARLAEIRH